MILATTFLLSSLTVQPIETRQTQLRRMEEFIAYECGESADVMTLFTTLTFGVASEIELADQVEEWESHPDRACGRDEDDAPVRKAQLFR